MDYPTARDIRPVASKGASLVRLSIFWRLALGSLAVIAVVAGVNLYALGQLRQLTALSTQLVTYHYPAIETAKRLTRILYAQLRSEKKYLAVRDTAFLKDFDEEADEFHRTLEVYIDLRETRVSALVVDSRARSARAEAITQQLVIVAALLGLGLAGLASYSILYPLSKVQAYIRQIGQGKFGASVDVVAPSDLRELVNTVNWMGKKLQELDNMKTDFLAHISHELRTPLASIREGTRLLLDQIPGPLTKEQRETLGIMTESSERLIHMISTLLDLSKMEAGMMEYRIVLTDLARLAETSVNKVRFLAEGKRIQILIDAPGKRLWVPADGLRIEQVLDNLLSNALKFSPEGGTVNLQMVADPAAGVMRVSVSDTGPGISPEDLSHIFERFYQGRMQARTTVIGTGLGLALAKNIVEAHGGRIWAQSELDK